MLCKHRCTSRQRRKAESGSNRCRSQLHRLRKLKPRKFLKSEFWLILQKFVPARITNHTVFLFSPFSTPPEACSGHMPNVWSCEAFPHSRETPAMVWETREHCLTSSWLVACVQWNLSMMDTIGNQHFVPYSKVSLTQGLPVYSGSLVCIIKLLSTTWLCFWELSFAVRWQGRLVLQVTVLI